MDLPDHSALSIQDAWEQGPLKEMPDNVLVAAMVCVMVVQTFSLLVATQSVRIRLYCAFVADLIAVLR